MEGDSRDLVCDTLARGEAVVVANPAPMAYGVVAINARPVNAVKGRPLDQNVAVSVHDRSLWRELAPCLDLPPTVLGPAVQLLRRRLTLVLPLSGSVRAPDWTRPATRDRRVAIFNGYWSELEWLWRRFPRLYGSSANRTGTSPATNVPEARGMFGEDRPIAAPTGPQPTTQRWSSSMIQIDPAGRITLHRSGFQDRSTDLAPVEFIRQVAGSVGLRPSPRGTTP